MKFNLKKGFTRLVDFGDAISSRTKRASSKLTTGFTLIELLVVVAIIGILASVVLASLSSARNKGKDSRAKSEMASMLRSAELYYSNCSSYNTTPFEVAVTSTGTVPATTLNGTCTNSSIFSDTQSNTRNLLLALTSGDAISPMNARIPVGGGAWSMAVTLPSGNAFYCVDSTGYVGGNKKGTTTPYIAVSGTDISPNSDAAHTIPSASVCN